MITFAIIFFTWAYNLVNTFLLHLHVNFGVEIVGTDVNVVKSGVAVWGVVGQVDVAAVVAVVVSQGVAVDAIISCQSDSCLTQGAVLTRQWPRQWKLES